MKSMTGPMAEVTARLMPYDSCEPSSCQGLPKVTLKGSTLETTCCVAAGHELSTGDVHPPTY